MGLRSQTWGQHLLTPAFVRGHSGKRYLTLDELVGFGVWWCKESGLNSRLEQSDLRAALRKQADLLELTDEQRISLQDAEILLEEMQRDKQVKIMIPFDIEEFQKYEAVKSTFLIDVELGKPLVQDDWLTFQAFAQAELTTSAEILKFAEDRGACVEVVNSAAKIKGHNGVQIDRLQCFTSKAWEGYKKGGDWKRVIAKLYEMGLREKIEESEEKEYCKWCKLFQSPEGIQTCTSTQRDCRRLASTTWRMKL